MHLNFCRIGTRASLETAWNLVEEQKDEDRDGEHGGNIIKATGDQMLPCK